MFPYFFLLRMREKNKESAHKGSIKKQNLTNIQTVHQYVGQSRTEGSGRVKGICICIE